MPELQKILQTSDAFKPDWMQAILTTGQQNITPAANTSTLSPDANLNVTPSSNTTTVVPSTQQMTGTSTATDVTNIASPNLNQMVNLNQQQQQPISQTETGQQKSDSENRNANTDQDLPRILTVVREILTDSRRLLIDHVTGAIVEAHTESTLNTHTNVAEANERASKSTTDMSESKLSASTTMWKNFLSSMAPEITKVVKFCTKLPGFSEMDQEDQSRLIKQGTFEVMVARFVVLIDETNETVLDPSLKMKSSRSVIQGMSLGPFVDQFFEVARKFNPLRLTDGEIGLYTAILMICPTRPGLKNATVINATQQLYLQALYCLMKRNHKDFEQRFSSLINMITIFRKINEDHQNLLNNIRKNHPEEFNRFPNLHKEVFEMTK